MHVLMGLTYYSPYVSGLTDAARLVAQELAARGHRVVVATTQHDPHLPPREEVAGVAVCRAPVVARIGKGVVAPGLPGLVRRLSRSADVVNLHLPLLEAGVLAVAAAPRPVVTTYQCDVDLPPGLVHDLQVRAIDASSRVALARSAAVAVSSADYAGTSRLAGSLSRAVSIAPPTLRRSGGLPAYRETAGPHVGFLGRLVEEKGVEHLVDAFRTLDDPDARLLIGGDYTRVAGGSVVERVRARMGDDPRIRLLGFLPDERLPDFYASLDAFVLPSVNSLEAFGIVQVEAMMAGVPVVASDLPGVRVPVRRTGFGAIARPGDAADIARALRSVLTDRPDRAAGAAAAAAAYGIGATSDAYEALFASLSRAGGAGRA